MEDIITTANLRNLWNNIKMSTQPSPANPTVEREKVYVWILELTSPETRETALLELRCV